MKIFYAVQATGNGHISRAMELLPFLQEIGTVDIFLSGDNSHLELDAPVRYRSKGISLFYNCKGGLDYWKIFKSLSPVSVYREIRDLPVEQYDLVLNDFDFITSAACSRKKIPSIHFGHQASFQSAHCPRPQHKNLAGEWLLKNYVSATRHIGLHFKSYDDFIYPAIVKKEILEAEASDQGHVTVYLPSYCEKELYERLKQYPDTPFEVFSKECSSPFRSGHIRFFPVTRKGFNQSLISCHGILSGAGFETPAEALHLGKKIMAIPIKGQYEQCCNAAALQEMGVTCLPSIGSGFHDEFQKWIQEPAPEPVNYSGSAEKCIETICGIVESRFSYRFA